ncbi:MAG: P-II family nitrogen regulator [Clostridia bacterium]|nr:P-II family nitrogen regulator [Clostridia bacterium]
MTGVKYIITITHREYAEDYTEFFYRHGVKNLMKIFATGSAKDKTLSALGIERALKVVLCTVVRENDAAEINKGLVREMNLAERGNGFSVCMSLDGIGGESGKQYLLGDKPLERKENSNMEEKSKYVLLVIIADKGNVDVVMDAARAAGATGGTVLPAKGTGAEIAKFFGVAISEEKEMIYIVAKREERDVIMKAIMEKAGKDTDAHGIVFSLPVESVIGIRSFDE